MPWNDIAYVLRHTKEHTRNMFTTPKNNHMAYTWWEIAIFIVGLISFVSILAVLFLPIANGPAAFTVSGAIPPVGSPEFGKMVSNSLTLPIRQGDQITALNNGDAFLKSLLTDIDGAHSSINIMVYIWTDGKMSDQVLEHLDQKLKQGVQVRIMIDAYGSSTNKPDKQFKILKDLGGKIDRKSVV